MCGVPYTLRSWGPDLVAHPGTQLSQRRSRTGCQVSLFGAARRAQGWNGDIPAEKTPRGSWFSGAAEMKWVGWRYSCRVRGHSPSPGPSPSIIPPLPNLPDKWKFQSRASCLAERLWLKVQDCSVSVNVTQTPGEGAKTNWGHLGAVLSAIIAANTVGLCPTGRGSWMHQKASECAGCEQPCGSPWDELLVLGLGKMKPGH